MQLNKDPPSSYLRYREERWECSESPIEPILAYAMSHTRHQIRTNGSSQTRGLEAAGNPGVGSCGSPQLGSLIHVRMHLSHVAGDEPLQAIRLGNQAAKLLLVFGQNVRFCRRGLVERVPVAGFEGFLDAVK